MGKKKGKGSVPDGSGDKSSEKPSSHKGSRQTDSGPSSTVSSPAHKKLRPPVQVQPQQRPIEQACRRDPPPVQSQPQQRPIEQQQAWRRDPPPVEGQPQQRLIEQQQAWRRDPPPVEGQPQQRPIEQQQAWRRDPSPVQGQPQQRALQQQQAWRRDPSPVQGQPQQRALQQQQAWRRDPSPVQGPPQQRALQQQQAWRRDPPPVQGQPQQRPLQQQQAWRRDPSPVQGQPQQRALQQQQAWRRDPSPVQGQPQQRALQQQQAWRRDPPPVQGQPQQRPLQQQQAWRRDPSPVQGPPQQRALQQQQAWRRDPSPVQNQPQQRPLQQQQAWRRDPPPVWGQPQQRPLEQQQAWRRDPSPVQGQPQRRPLQQQQAWRRDPSPVQNQPQQRPIEQQQAWRRDPPPAHGQPQKEISKKDEISPTAQTKTILEGPFEFPQRIFAPKKSGRNIEILSNFFLLRIMNPNITVFHYDVVFEPEKPKHLFRKVWNKFISLVFPGRLTAFDGKNAYSRGPLTNDRSASSFVTVFNTENNKDKEFKVTITEVRRINFSTLHNYSEKIKQNSSIKIPSMAEISVLEIIMKNWASDHYVAKNHTFFPPASTLPVMIELSQKLCLKFGYFQSLFLGIKPYLNFDIAHKCFYKEGPVLNILDCFRQKHTKALDVEEMTRFMRNVKVKYVLPNDPSAKIFRVNKLVEDAMHQSFKKEDGTEFTVAKYFEMEKKCKLNYPNLPLLWVGPTQKNIYLPMEFCSIISDQIYQGCVDPLETKNMVQNSTTNARDRKRNIENVFFKNNLNSHPLMREFELEVLDQMERVPARVLNPPRLKTSRSIKVDSGVWRIQDFLEPVTLKKWCILNLDKHVQKQAVSNLQGMIKNKGNEYNMQISDPARAPIDGDPSFTELKKAFSQLKDMDLVFVIISEVKGVYSRVKAICETQEGILTQCIKSKTVAQDPRKLTTTVQNILLKVNAKLGGKNHCLDQSSIPQCLNGYVMVVGADVTHPSPGMNIPSVAAITVSCDPTAFQYGTTTRVQPKGEIIVDLEKIMVIHLKKFYELRKNYPEKIIFFRDGVSEGELEKVLKKELTALKKACHNYCQPKVTFVIVQKRHHARLFPSKIEDEDGKHFNVPVGTCVDSNIVNPRDLDFYLLSHSTLLGTARPTRYRLVYDDNKFTDDELETLSYYLCHLFSRCNRSVSYPSPTFNAHLAAARVRAYLEGLNLLSGQDVEYIQKEIKDKISSISTMFFI